MSGNRISDITYGEKTLKKAKQISFGLATTLALVILFSSFPSYAQARQPFLTRHVREIITNGEALPVGRLPETQTLRFDIVMPLRDRAALQTYLQELYDPSSRSFHHFLTPQEVTARYGPSQQDWDALAAFAKASGFEVLGGTRDGRDLWLTGTVANIEKAFNVTMTVYQDPTEEGRTFFSPDREPTTSLPFPLWHVSGLNNDAKPHPLYVKKSEYAKAHDTDPDAISNATTGSGPDASFLGSDMRHAYYCNGSCGADALTGTGQNIALFEFAGTDLTDLSTYYNNVGQTEPYTPTLISTGGYGTSCVDSGGRSKACDDTEQTLDMTQSMGMAPGSTMLYMYVCGDVLADNEGNISDTACISAMVSTTDAPLSMQISCSWGWTPDDPSTLDPYFEQMASQGQNFFAASGDDSAWSSSNEAWPADDANIVSVGGTDLTTSAAAGPWESETAWADSGGGVSPDDIPIPSWQTPVDGCSGCSKTYRNGPDVSANANFSFYVCADQTTCTANEYGGTSFATPMWAGYLALANEQAASNNESIGYINPNIYPAAEGSSYGTYFHDITSGSCGTYSAATGYDLCTGWGSPNTSGLINLLAPTGSNASTTTAVSSNLNPSTYGQDVTFTATVTASGSPVTSGTVQFVVDGNDLGSPVAVNAQGEAQATDAALSVGTHSVAANYLGATGYSSSSGSLSQVVNQASQTITCSTKPPTSAAYGSSFTIACTASSGLAVSYSSSGSCSNSGAAYTMTSASGACAVDVNQAGNSDYSAAPQVAYSVGATKATTSINVTSVNPSSEVYGQDAAVTITAVASWTGSGSAPSGSIVIGGNGNGTYSATSCGAPSGDTITCTATYTPNTNDVVGSYTETATIAGDSNYSGSSSPQTNNFSITQAGSGTITVSCTPDPSTYGGSVTCTATIPGQYNEITHKGKVRSQVVTGTVEWSSNTGCGTTTVNSGDPGTATCTTTILPVGSDTVTANYSGDSNHSAGSGSTSQTVNQVTTTTAISSSLDPSGYGQAVSFMATVTGSNPTGTVQFLSLIHI